MLTDKLLGYEPGIKGSNPFENMKKERFYSSPFLYLYFQQSDIWYPRSLSVQSADSYMSNILHLSADCSDPASVNSLLCTIQLFCK